MRFRDTANGKTVVIGVGSAGSEAVCHIKDSFDDSVEFILVDNDFDSFEKLLDAETIARDMNAGVYETEREFEDGKRKPYFYILAKNPPLTKQRLEDVLEGARSVFIVSWVGWGTSATPGLAKKVTLMARAGGAQVNVIALLPLEEKEELRESIKDSHKIHALKSRSDTLVMLDSNELETMAEDMTEEEAFELLRPKLVQQIRAKL